MRTIKVFKGSKKSVFIELLRDEAVLLIFDSP